MDSLERWSATLAELASRLDPELMERLKKERVIAFQSYTEPVDKKVKEEGDEDDEKIGDDDKEKEAGQAQEEKVNLFTLVRIHPTTRTRTRTRAHVYAC
jgi:hypothetical protein